MFRNNSNMPIIEKIQQLGAWNYVYLEDKDSILQKPESKPSKKHKKKIKMTVPPAQPKPQVMTDDRITPVEELIAYTPTPKTQYWCCCFKKTSSPNNTVELLNPAVHNAKI